MKRLSLSLCMGVLFSTMSFANAATLEITQAWSRPATDIAVGYFTVTNHGPQTDSIDQAQSPIAQEVTLHQSKELPMDSKMGGMGSMPAMSMIPIHRLAVPAHSSIQLAPGGYHLMLTGLRHPLKRGTSFPLRVHFMRRGWITTIVHVH